MPPKKNDHFSLISDRQKRKRISVARQNLKNANVVQNAGTLFSSSFYEKLEEIEILPVEEEGALRNDINLIQQDQDEFLEEEEFFGEEIELSNAETVSCNEDETEDEDPEATFLEGTEGA